MSKYIGEPQSGSRRADTYSRNAYGAYIRNRAIPTNPNSIAQQAIRARFTAASQAWRNLSEMQRVAWSDYAETHPSVNALGEVIVLKGNAMFVKIRGQQKAAGLATTSAPPADPSFAFSGVALVAAAGTPTLTVSGSTQPAGYMVIIRASGQLSPGVTRPPTMKQIVAVDGATWSTPVSILTEYTALFGALVEGKKIIVDARFVSDEGVYGGIPRTSDIVAA